MYNIILNPKYYKNNKERLQNKPRERCSEILLNKKNSY